MRPLCVHEPPTIVPVWRWPEASVALVPCPSSNVYAATGATGGVGSQSAGVVVSMVRAEVRPAASNASTPSW